MNRILFVASALVVASTASAQSLDLSGDCPGTVDVTISGFTPGGTAVFLGGAAGEGSDVIGIGACAGTVTGLAGVRFLTRVSADGGGTAAFAPYMGDASCDTPIQVLDTATCTMSNVTSANAGGGGGDGGCPAPGGSCTFDSPSYAADMYLSPSTGCTPMNIAFDGTYYYGYSGGTTSCRMNQWDDAGGYLGDFGPGVDGRSVFTRVGCSAPTYINGYNSRDIMVEVSPGSYAFEVALVDGTFDSQTVMSYDHVRDLFVSQALSGLTVDRWSSDGAFYDSFALVGGAHEGYANAVSNNGCYLSFNGTTLYSYDGDTGALIDSTTLEGAGMPSYSFGYANGRVFINDGGGWNGWAVGI
ncbi:MAG: hypothetical protein ACI8PZ_000490 [Myxococcota bacterium]|jgi:hypothetical protein